MSESNADENLAPDPSPGELPVVDPEATEPHAGTASPCRHLRHKGMYVYTDGSAGESSDDYDSTMYWCLQTMKGFGPDDDIVSGHECRNPDRTCYEPT